MGAGKRQMLALDGSLHQAIFQLHAGDRSQPSQIVKCLRPRDNPGRHIGKTEMQYLASANGIIIVDSDDNETVFDPGASEYVTTP